MAEEGFSNLGKQLADLGLSFVEVNKRLAKMQSDKKRDILKGFANAIIASNPSDAYLAAKAAGDDLMAKSAARKLLDSNLRQASRAAIDADDEDLMELVIQEAERKGDRVLAEMTKRELKDKRRSII